MLKVEFIVNPRAGNGRAGRVWAGLKDRLPPGHRCEVRVTKRPQDTIDRARGAERRGVDRVVAVGGDGTMNQVASQLVGTGCALAHLPLGTSNDWARSLDVPRDPRAALRTVFTGRSVRLDVGRLNNRRYFFNVAGAGFDGQVVHTMNRWRPPALVDGRLAWLACVGVCLPYFRDCSVNLRLDERRFDCPDFQLIAVGIGGFYGGGLPVFPHADPGDGRFEVAWIHGRSRTELLRLVPRIFQKRHFDRPGVCYHRARELTLNSHHPLPVQLDGEEAGTTPMTLRIIPGGIRAVVPRQARTLGGGERS